MLLWLVRGVFGILIVGLATSALMEFYGKGEDAVGIAALVTILAIGALTVALDAAVPNKQITTISAVYFGLLLGFLLGNFFWTALEPFVREATGGTEHRAELIIRVLVIFISCYLTVSTLLQTKDEFRFIIPYVEFSKQMKGSRPLVLDTSVIIDGRIADLCETRIIDSRLIVPRFVLQELQHIADSSDKLKRKQGSSKIELEVHEANLPELRDVFKVDERLVVLAKVLSARVVTNDYNLNKIAQLQGVEVINLNEIANSLKSVALPGESLNVKLVKPGDQPGQGVGYLEDGTMVVVEHGRSALGQDVAISVTSVLQNPAGRMIFGRLEPKPTSGSGAGTEIRPPSVAETPTESGH